MTSEIKVDTISEQTSANGVTIDGLTIKDGNIIGDVALAGTTPTFTVGDGGAEDAALIFDGNAVDYYMALDDSADNLIIGSGSTVGSNSLITIDSDGDFTLDSAGDIILDVGGGDIKLTNAGTNVGEINLNSNGGDIQLANKTQDKDITFHCNDGGGIITVLTLDGSAAGAATFNSSVAMTSFAATVGSTITTADNTDTLSLISTDADASVGPNLRLYRNSSSPADGDQLAKIDFEGRNDNSQDVSYFDITAYTRDVSDGTEDGILLIHGIKAGSSVEYIRIDPHADHNGIVFNDGSTDMDFRVESNGNTHMLFVDGGENRIGFGTNTPGRDFQFLTTDQTDVSIIAANNQYAQLLFGDPDDDNIGSIGYNNSSNAMEFHANATQIFTIHSDGVVFNEASNDQNFRVESNSHTHCLFIDAGNDRVGVGESTDTGGKFRVSLGDSGQNSVDAAGQGIVIEDNANTGLSILTPNDSTGNILFGDPDNNDSGFIRYNHGADDMYFSVNGNGSVYTLILHDSNAISTSGETSPDVGEGGITLDQNAADTKILTFKSSDVAHGITNEAETDTYAFFDKNSSNDGGLDIFALSERTDGEFFRLIAAGASIQTTKAVNAIGAFHLVAAIKNGTALGGCDADDNLLTLSNGVNTRFIFDNEGTMHSDVGTATYDEYEDAHLVRAMDLSTSTKGLIASKFDEFVQYNHEDLANASIVGRDENGTPNTMVNWTAMSQLHNGAIWQQYEKHQKLTNAMYELAKAAVGEDKADEILKKHDIKLLN